MNLNLNIYSFIINLYGLDDSLANKISNDFNYFIIPSLATEPNLSIYIKVSDITANMLPSNIVPTVQNEKLIKYVNNETIYYNYHYDVLVKEEKDNQTTIISNNPHRLHEIIYLYILSKSGKYMDLHGMHKIHAFALQTHSHNIIYAAASHGGKTSTFLNLIENSKLKIFSEDTPVIDNLGYIHPFPLRVGVKEKNKIKFIDKSHIYEIERKEYGKKFLFSLATLKNEIAKSSNLPTIILFAKRSNATNPQLEKINFLKIFIELIPHIIIGIGLPMIIEFFLQSNYRDLFNRLHILLSRIKAALALTKQSTGYILHLTEDIEKNSLFLKNYLTSLK